MLNCKHPKFEADIQQVLLVFIKTAFHSIFYTILWIPVYITRYIIVKFVQKYESSSYGKIFDANDACLEQDILRNHLVFSLELDGPLELEELRRLFTTNVLEAKITDKKTGKDILRYPEFKQYQTLFAGFRFWKNDDYFNISNHIFQQPYNKSFQNLSKVHQEAANKVFPNKRSPWDIVLVRNYKNNPDKTLLLYKCHHTLADTKSCMKVLVECLGEKGNLKQPNVQYLNNSFLDKIRFYILLPFYFVYFQVFVHYTSIKSEKSPWKWTKEEEPKLNLAISKGILMNDVKAIAKRNQVTASAVIMAAVAGGIQKSDKRFAKSMPIHWVLPKMNHPEVLANHNYSAIMDLPTNITSPHERLMKCNKIFLQLKSSTLHIYDKCVVFQLGTWFSPLRQQFLENKAIPLIITNIAGDGEGFSVGGKSCSDFTMTCGPLPGASSCIICTFSYKDEIKLSATVKDGMLNEVQTHKLVEWIVKDFEILKKAT